MNIIDILDMLDWNKSDEIQAEGRYLAKNIKKITCFIQPLTPRHNKNVWDNCAIIISEKNDAELEPYLNELLEWLQDLNWPGAPCILKRLQKYFENKSSLSIIDIAIKKAKCLHDETWENNLNTLKVLILGNQRK